MILGRRVIRNCLLVSFIGLATFVFAATLAAQEDDYPFALGRLGGTQTGPYVQSGPAVVKLVLRLAEEEEYTSEQATALAEALTVLLKGDLPPGTLLQASKELLAAMSPADLLVALDELGRRIMDGEPPGQVANDLLERGNGHGKPDTPGKGSGEDDEDEDLDDDDADLDDEDEADDPGNGHGKPDTPGKGSGEDDEDLDEDDEDLDNEDEDLDDEEEDLDDEDEDLDDEDEDLDDDDQDLDDEDEDLDDDDEDLDDDDEDLDDDDEDLDDEDQDLDDEDEDDPGNGHGKPDDPGHGKGKGKDK